MSDRGVRRFIISHEAWYAFAQPGADPEISIGYDNVDGGGTFGEFGIRWYSLGGKRVPRLEVYDDGWEVLHRQFSGLIRELAKLDDANPTPAEIAVVLRGLGVEDQTERTRPEHLRRVPQCPCCRRDLPIEEDSE